jgi:hypothetical protein
VAGLPDLAESADAEELIQLPIDPGDRTVSRLEPRHPVWQEGEEVFRPPQYQVGGDRRAGRVRGPPQRLANPSRDLHQDRLQRPTILFAASSSDLFDDPDDIPPNLIGRRDHEGLQFVPSPSLVFLATPGFPDVGQELGQDLDAKLTDHSGTRRLERGLADEFEQGEGCLIHVYLRGSW